MSYRIERRDGIVEVNVWGETSREEAETWLRGV
jgi:hypothetical protein